MGFVDTLQPLTCCSSKQQETFLRLTSIGVEYTLYIFSRCTFREREKESQQYVLLTNRSYHIRWLGHRSIPVKNMCFLPQNQSA